MNLPYGTRQVFELPCKECAWWKASGSGEWDDPLFVGQVEFCANPLAVNGMPPLLSAHETCPGFEPREGYPDYSEDGDKEMMWGSSSEILDLATAIDLIEEGRIERPGKHASANLPFQSITAEGIKFLCQYEYHNIGLAVTHLTRPISEALSQWGVSVIRFLNPISLDHDGLEPFRDSAIELNFWGGVTGLDVSAAQILASCTGGLLLTDINLTSNVAEALSRRMAGASLHLTGEHGPDVLHYLAHYRGDALFLSFDLPLGKEALAALCSNPDRYVYWHEGEDSNAYQVLNIAVRNNYDL